MTFKLNDGYKLIDFTVSYTDFPNSIKKEKDDVYFSFAQWRTNEKIDIIIYAEQLSNESKDVKLEMNEREIIDGEIANFNLSQVGENEAKTIVEFFPKPIVNILFWIGVLFYGLLILIFPYGVYSEVSKLLHIENGIKNTKLSFLKE